MSHSGPAPLLSPGACLVQMIKIIWHVIGCAAGPGSCAELRALPRPQKKRTRRSRSAEVSFKPSTFDSLPFTSFAKPRAVLFTLLCSDENKSRAFAHLALHLYLSTVRFDDVFDNRHPRPVPPTVRERSLSPGKNVQKCAAGGFPVYRVRCPAHRPPRLLRLAIPDLHCAFSTLYLMAFSARLVITWLRCSGSPLTQTCFWPQRSRKIARCVAVPLFSAVHHTGWPEKHANQ